MTKARQKKITEISKQFASGFNFGGINGTTWLIVDPLSAYLNSLGYKNNLHQILEKDNHPMVLVMTFLDGDQFIPAGGDLKYLNKKFKNWCWI